MQKKEDPTFDAGADANESHCRPSEPATTPSELRIVRIAQPLPSASARYRMSFNGKNSSLETGMKRHALAAYQPKRSAPSVSDEGQPSMPANDALGEVAADSNEPPRKQPRQFDRPESNDAPDPTLASMKKPQTNEALRFN